MSVLERLEHIEAVLHNEFPDVLMEITWQVFNNHAEIWVYVLNLSRFDNVRDFCRDISQDHIATESPEIWLLAKTWTGPWPGGNSEVEIRESERLERRREEFRLRTGFRTARQEAI